MFRLNKLTILIVSLIFLSNHSLNSQNNNYYFDNYVMEDGLIHNYVISIYQDSRDILWVATYGGVQAFNGRDFNIFNVAGKKIRHNILSNTVVHSMYEDKDKNMWFGTERGLNKYNPYTGEIVKYFGNPERNSISSNNVRAIYQDKEGIFWFGTYSGGLNKFDEKADTFTHFRTETDKSGLLRSNLINTMFIDKDGLFWIGTEDGGLSVFDPKAEKFIMNIADFIPELENFTVNNILQDDYNNFWIGTWSNGLIKYNPTTKEVKRYTSAPNNPMSISGNNVKSIVLKEKDVLWISTYGNGINILDLKTESIKRVKITSNDPESTAQDFIWASFVDKENNLWFGTFGKGLYKLNTLRNTFSYKKLQINNQKLNISSASQGSDNSIWLGTFNNGVYLYDIPKNKFSEFKLNHKIDNQIYSLYTDGNDNCWIGTDNALYMSNANQSKLRYFNHKPEKETSISKSTITKIMEDKKGNIWLGFWEQGVNVILKNDLLNKNDDDVKFTKLSNLVDSASFQIMGNVLNLFEDSNGDIIITTSQDVIVYNPNNHAVKSINISVVTSMHEDKLGNYWLGTNGNGVYKLDKNKQLIKNYIYEQGLNCIDIQAMQVDDRERLWLATSCGLSVLDTKTELILNFNNTYGLKQYSTNINASLKLNDGRTLFAGNNGLNMFNANNINKSVKASNIQITEIKLNNEPIAYENSTDSVVQIKSLLCNLDTLVLDSKNKILSLKFAAVNYQTPDDITYAYKLEGINNDWVISEADNRSATYSNLEPGKYLFKVKMTYSKGNWNENIKTLLIIIKPEYWQTWWFKLLIGIISLIALFFIVRLIFKKNKLVLIVKQKHRFVEDLRKEKEILFLKNEELKDEVEQYNNKIQALSVSYKALKENLNLIYQNMMETMKSVPEQSSGKLNKISKSFQEKISTLEDFALEDSIQIDKDDFLLKFAQAYPKLSTNDLRTCSLIRKNKTNKEIAQILNITQGSLEQSRYRMRKKMNLSSDVNLNELIIRF